MKVEKLTWEAALESGREYPWMLVHALSGVALGRSGEIAPAEELLDAHFFSEQGAIRVFRDGDTLRAVRFTPEEGDAYAEERRTVENPALGKALTVRKYLTYDEDGQCVVKTILPVKWEGGSENG